MTANGAERTFPPVSPMAGSDPKRTLLGGSTCHAANDTRRYENSERKPSKYPKRIIVRGASACAVEIRSCAVKFCVDEILCANPRVEASAKPRTFAAERRIVCLQDEPAAVGPQGAIVAIEQRIRLAPCVERADTAAEHVLPVIGRIHANIVEVVMR